MGVNGFFALLATKAPEAREFLRDTSTIEGRRLGVDAPIFLHRAKTAHPDNWSYLTYIMHHLLWLRTLRCPAVFVFDGDDAQEAKLLERAKRNSRRLEQQAALDQWTDRLAATTEWDSILECRAQIAKCTRSCVRVTETDRTHLKRLVDMLGFAWHVAPGEAEQFLACLQLGECVDEIVTEDSDALVCGACSIVRNFWGLCHTDISAHVPPQRIHMHVALNYLQADQAQLRVASVLAGCDFAPKLKNIGLVRALKASQVCSDLKQCMCNVLKVSEVPSETLDVFGKAVSLLSASPYSTDVVSQLGAINADALSTYVKEVEEDGEPWALRQMTIPRSNLPISFITPSSWLAPMM